MVRTQPGGSEFVAYFDALGEADGRHSLIGWKTTTSRYSVEREGLLAGAPGSKLKRFEQALLKDDFEKICTEVDVKQIAIPGGEEGYILCRAVGRGRKREPSAAAL